MPVTPPALTDHGDIGTWGPLVIQGFTDLAAQGNASEAALPGKAAVVHAATHAAAGADPVTITEAQVTGLAADLAAIASSLAGKALATRTVGSGTGLTGGGDLTADRTLTVAYGTGAGTSCQGNDGRLSDPRTPIAHNHAASEITSGTLTVDRGGTGVTTIAALQAALGLGLGANMYRASTGSAAGDTASGARTMVGYDTTGRVDTGYTCNQSAGTITVPSDGYYLVTGHTKLSAAYTGGFVAMAVTDGSNDLIRGDTYQVGVGGVTEFGVGGTTPFVTAGTALRVQPFTSTSTSLVGSADGARYYLRVVRVG